MEGQRQTQWQEILLITQKMQELAVPNKLLSDLSIDEETAKEPWQAITELEKERSLLLKGFFSQEAGKDEVVEIAEGIMQIQTLDKALYIIGQNLQNEIGSTFTKLGNAQRAVTEYSQNSKS